ncbi:thyrotropin-releasing hormone-degrading ectoenzyme isoform X1 [Drosophila elegans]|uniref:thyrotropin-releasing hormone-degrading ectoenzyme isoform X1 n=1 Tax=Drosophila elegans TaxID=30023 RepID=UPI001BC84264|nr:thyrotropin-releasing hormone-degrading ectoenzyme isoform X1 [Drosophila elegans]
MVRLIWHLVVLQLCLLNAAPARNYRRSGSPPLIEPRSQWSTAADVRPLHYNLSLLTEVDEVNLHGTFQGELTIRVRVWRETRTIVLSTNGLRVDPKVWLIRKNTGGRVAVRKLWHDVRHQRFGIHFKSLLWLGEEYSLMLAFSGKLSRTSGYFVAGYVDASSHPQWVAASQLAPNLANTVFPCFEDSTLLSPFVLNLAHTRDTNAVSNTRVRATSDHERDNYMWTSFHQTPPMSVQKLAFSINRFTGQKSPRLAQCPEMITWLRPRIADQGAYAIGIAPHIIVFFVDLFGKPYPSVKIDQLVLPDTAYQSHEHMGLVSYPEGAFLYSEQGSTAMAKQQVASHVAQEFSHHWFSDLESPSLYWLHYGLSDYLAGFAVDKVEPTWRLHELAMVRQGFDVLDEDSRASAQAVSLAHTTQSAVDDSHAYQKSALLFRMLHSLIGTQVFVNAIRLYIRRGQKGASNQTLLWKTFQEESDRQMSLRQDIQVSQLMESWTLQPGYPLVKVVRDYATQRVTVTQERFLRNPRMGGARSGPISRRQCWWVPLTFTTAGRGSWVSALPSEWLTCQAHRPARPLVLTEVAPPDDWVVFNLRVTTPCRVTYDDRNWGLIGQALAGPNASNIDRFTRAQLVSDVLSLAGAGVVTYDLALGFLQNLQREDEFIVWQAAARNLRWLHRTLHNTPIISVFKSFMWSILQPKFDELFNPRTRSPGKNNKLDLKGLILMLACQTDMRPCADLALKEFAGLTLKSNRIPIDQRETIYCTAIRYGTEADWTLLRRLYTRSNVAEERGIILRALTCSRENWALDKMLGLAFGSRYLPKGDVLLIFSAMAQNPLGFILAKRYLVDNIQAITKFYRNSTDEIAQLVTVLMEKVSTETELDYLRKLMKKELRYLPGIEATSRRILDLGHDIIAWHKIQYLRLVSAVCNITGSIEPQCLY